MTWCASHTFNFQVRLFFDLKNAQKLDHDCTCADNLSNSAIIFFKLFFFSCETAFCFSSSHSLRNASIFAGIKLMFFLSTRALRANVFVVWGLVIPALYLLVLNFASCVSLVAV